MYLALQDLVDLCVTHLTGPMKIQGDLSSISLSELFKALSDQRATGILSVTSSMGEKHIALARGEITVFSDRLSERTRIGDLLVARGKLDDKKLTEALRFQKQAEKRLVLGELLIEKNFVRKEDIHEAVKFQLEEEICDIFTWKDAAFDFDSTRTAEEIENEWNAIEGAQGHVHRLSIDPQTLLLEATRRMDEWAQFAERVPTPYLCFRVSKKGEDLYAKTSPQNQRMIKLIREGRTLETTVKLSFVGRFTTYKSVVRFLDDGWISPYPTAELRFLASEHRTQDRFADALFIYRRLHALADTDAVRQALQKSIDDTIDHILRLKSSGRRPEGLDFVSHKEAAASFKRRQKIFHAVSVAILLSAIIAGYAWWLANKSKAPPPEKYQAAVAEVNTALDEGHFEDAILIWHRFSVSHVDPESEWGKSVQDRHDLLLHLYRNHVEKLFHEAKFLQDTGKLEQAEEAYKRMMIECPNNIHIDEVKAAFTVIEERRVGLRESKDLETWTAKLNTALEHESHRQYERAKACFIEASEGAPAGSTVRGDAEKGLARLQRISARIRDSYQIALERLKERKAEKVIEMIEGIQSEWPEDEWAQKARKQSVYLRSQHLRLREDVVAARGEEERGQPANALKTYERILKEYAEFEESLSVIPRMEELGAKMQNAGELLARVRAAEKVHNIVEARSGYGQLLAIHRSFLVAQKVGVPVQIASHPSGAAIKVNGIEKGKTPAQVELPAGEDLVLSIEFVGFAPFERRIVRLEPADLEITARLERAAFRILKLSNSVKVPPMLLDGILYLSAGASVMACESNGSRILWTSDSLSSERAAVALGPDRRGLDDTPNWWHLQAQPLVTRDGTLIVPSPLRETHTVKKADGSSKVLFKLPAEPVGACYLETGSALAGKELLACAYGDGKVRVYDLAAPKIPIWTQVLAEGDPLHAVPVGGILPAGPGTCVTVSRSGLLRAWELATGRKLWELPLGAEISDVQSGPAESKVQGRRHAALTTRKGGLILADIAQGKKLWEYLPEHPGDRINAASVDTKRVYATSRNGTFLAFPVDRALGALKTLWEKPLDDTGAVSLPAGATVYVPTNSGTILAIASDSGKELWRFRCKGKPLTLAVSDKYLYVCTSESELVVLEK